MSASSVIKATAGIVALVYLAFFIHDGLPVHEALAPYGAAVSAATILWLAFDRLLWRIPGIRQHVAHRPLLFGTWRGTLTPKSTNPETGEPWPSDEDVYLVVTQSYSTIHVTMHTRNGSSNTVTTRLERAPDGAQELYSVYRFEPHLGGRDTNPIHYGSLRLGITDTAAPRLSGSYWTDRETIGLLEFTKRKAQRARNLDDARALFTASAPAPPASV